MIESTLEKAKKYLKDPQIIFAPLLEIPLTDKNTSVIDLSNRNSKIQDVNINDQESFTKIISDQLTLSSAKVGIGGYLEERLLYNQRENFNGEEKRTIHLGVDLWVSSGTVVYAPLEGQMHSFNNNVGLGNYGPTIILKHKTDHFSFYTLYGHLSETSLEFKTEETFFKKGALLGRVGDAAENGGWPPHLHFQIILDMGNYKGDFPGVSAPSALEKYRQICPDPNLILRLKKLK